FQAEDGIRDFHVTGVQTCALPIFEAHRVDEASAPVPDDRVRASAALPGVTGAWSFLGRRVTTSPAGDLETPGRLRLTLHWCEDRSEERRVGKAGQTRSALEYQSNV